MMPFTLIVSGLAGASHATGLHQSFVTLCKSLEMTTILL